MPAQAAGEPHSGDDKAFSPLLLFAGVGMATISWAVSVVVGAIEQ